MGNVQYSKPFVAGECSFLCDSCGGMICVPIFTHGFLCAVWGEQQYLLTLDERQIAHADICIIKHLE